MDYPEYIKAKIRGTLGLEDLEDTSKDEQINKMDAEAAFRHVCQWELGDGSWGQLLLGWAKDCGFIVTEKRKR